MIAKRKTAILNSINVSDAVSNFHARCYRSGGTKSLSEEEGSDALQTSLYRWVFGHAGEGLTPFRIGSTDPATFK